MRGASKATREIRGPPDGSGGRVPRHSCRALGHGRILSTDERDFRAYRSTGSDTDEFVRYVSEQTAEDLGPLFEEWVFSVNWLERLRAGDTLEDLVASYER